MVQVETRNSCTRKGREKKGKYGIREETFKETYSSKKQKKEKKEKKEGKKKTGIRV